MVGTVPSLINAVTDPVLIIEAVARALFGGKTVLGVVVTAKGLPGIGLAVPLTSSATFILVLGGLKS